MSVESNVIEVWNNLGRNARIGLIAGILAIVAVTLAAMWLVRTEYQVLFSDLAPQDAGAMVSELERMKVPYKLGDNGASILVDKDLVHQTRIKLMSKELPLHGTLGFELFNNTDFGMTEFAQKINYQRALQGEITRTILSLAEIQAARVHLALPEEGLFKRANSVPKASITLAVKQGQSLRGEQVSGIQRLVSAAVSGIALADVTIIDQHGVALTRLSRADGDDSSSRLELKKEMEKYLGRKVSEVLDRTFGVGQALATVDVSLNMDQIKTTIEDVVAPPAKSGEVPTGTLVREREVLREGTAPLDAKAGTSGGSSQREVEYSVGRRVENIVAMPGSIRRIDVVAVVRKPLDAAQQDRIRSIVAAAVGASLERGDSVVVQPLNALGAVDSVTANGAVSASGNDDADASATAMTKDAQGNMSVSSNKAEAVKKSSNDNGLLVSVLLGLIALVAGAVFWLRRSVGEKESAPLSEEQKRVLMAKLQGWMNESAAESAASGGRS